MSLKTYFSGLFQAFTNKRYAGYPDQRLRDYYYGVSSYTDSQEMVTINRGSKISTVFTCVNTIAQDISKLPFNVVKDTDQGALLQRNHPLYRIIHSKPNRNTTAFNFWYSIMWQSLTKGNGIAIIIRDNMMNPSELIQIDYDDVNIQMEDGDLFYDINGVGVLPSRDVLHFKMYSYDGIHGISPIMWNANIMGYKIKQEKYSARAIGTKGQGFISSTGLTNEQGQEIAKGMKAQISQGSIPFLGTKGDTKWHNQMITPNEAQYIETKKQTNTEIFGIFRMPPSMAQNYEGVPLANAEQQDLVYVKQTLTPWMKLIEQECNVKLFREMNLNRTYPFETKFDEKAILRGDIATRFKWYHDMLLDGVMNADEVRALENMPPQPDGLGQKYYIQGAMVEKGTNPDEEPSEEERKLREIETLLR